MFGRRGRGFGYDDDEWPATGRGAAVDGHRRRHSVWLQAAAGLLIRIRSDGMNKSCLDDVEG